MPVAVFIATAVRFGGDRRDRRLAALRLVGADARTTRRIAAGEALFGALLGLAVGAGFFLAGTAASSAMVDVAEVSVFPSDLRPGAGARRADRRRRPARGGRWSPSARAARVAIEPLGVVRDGAPRRRRLWWRLLLPVAGSGCSPDDRPGQQYRPGHQRVRHRHRRALLLVGADARCCPGWSNRSSARLRGGPVPWQLAVRRLQLSSGTAARRSAASPSRWPAPSPCRCCSPAMRRRLQPASPGQDPHRAQLTVTPGRRRQAAQRTIDDFRATKGVAGRHRHRRRRTPRAPARPRRASSGPRSTISVGDCATLRELARDRLLRGRRRVRRRTPGTGR